MLVLRPTSSLQCLLSPIVVASLLCACSGTAKNGGAGDSTESGVNSNAPASAGASGSAGSGGSPAANAGSGGGSSEAMNGDIGLSQGGSTASGSGAAGGAPIASNTDAGTAPDAAAPAADAGAAGMSFFVTSRGGGNGGNFGGLAGADQFCTTLASAVSPELGAKTWRAYLSTSTVDARDRIGTGPWVNAAGVVIGTSVAQLHDEAPGGASEATWPLNNPTIALDERGNQVPLQPLLHDILTGSNVDGTVSAIGTCDDWTQTTGMTMNGHSNRAGQANSGGIASSWSSSHMTGCGEPTNGMNFQGGTVSLGGGRGSIYCFAID
jgi:hypothetical protein